MSEIANSPYADRENAKEIMALCQAVHRMYGSHRASENGWPAKPDLSKFSAGDRDQVKMQYRARVISFAQPLMGYDEATMLTALQAHRVSERGRFVPSISQLRDILLVQTGQRSAVSGQVAAGALLGAAIRSWMERKRTNEPAFKAEYIEHEDGSVEIVQTRRYDDKGEPIRTWQEIAGPIISGFIEARGGIAKVAEEIGSGTLHAQLRDYYRDVAATKTHKDDWDDAVEMQKAMPRLAEAAGVTRILQPPDPSKLEGSTEHPLLGSGDD